MIIILDIYARTLMWETSQLPIVSDLPENREFLLCGNKKKSYKIKSSQQKKINKKKMKSYR